MSYTQNIFNIETDTFNNDVFHLVTPKGIQGGGFFSRILYNSKPLYIETTSYSKNGVITIGKKQYTIDNFSFFCRM